MGMKKTTPKNIDDYISGFPEEVQVILESAEPADLPDGADEELQQVLQGAIREINDLS